MEDGAIFYTTSDTETIVQLIAKSKRVKTIDKIVDAIFQIQGGYALVMLTQTSLVGVRDPYGIRPLVIGKLKDSFILASETCALDIVGAKFLREVENGEIVIIENNEISSVKPFPKQKARPCVFEYIYFARPDSLIDGKCAYEYRKNFGMQLAKESDVISIHVHVSNETIKLINSDFLNHAKSSTFFVNTSRGEIINEDDLIIALSTNVIAGAGLDVYVNEPLSSNNKLRFLPNALLLPHIGYVTVENYSIFYTQMLENLEAFVKNKPIRVLNE